MAANAGERPYLAQQKAIVLLCEPYLVTFFQRLTKNDLPR